MALVVGVDGVRGDSNSSSSSSTSPSLSSGWYPFSLLRHGVMPPCPFCRRIFSTIASLTLSPKRVKVLITCLSLHPRPVTLSLSLFPPPPASLCVRVCVCSVVLNLLRLRRLLAFLCLVAAKQT